MAHNSYLVHNFSFFLISRGWPTDSLTNVQGTGVKCYYICLFPLDFIFTFILKTFSFFQKRLYFYSVSGSEKNDFYKVTFSSLISNNPMKCLSTECSFSSVFFLLLSKRAEQATVPFFVVIFSFKSFFFPFFYARHWSGMLVVNMFSFYLPAFLLYLSVVVCTFIVVIVFCHSLPPSTPINHHLKNILL